MYASLSLELPNIITNLMLRSTSKTLPDGTVVFSFKGALNPTQLHLVYFAAEAQSDSGFVGETENFIHYIGDGKGCSWIVRQEKSKVKTNTFKVTFTLSDYTNQK